jgi:hypothetical protein
MRTGSIFPIKRRRQSHSSTLTGSRCCAARRARSMGAMRRVARSTWSPPRQAQRHKAW